MSSTLTGDAEKPMEQPNDDISNDGKTSPNLSDMPLDVVGMIIERSDYKEQLVLRKVSKSIRSLVDQQKPSCTSLQLMGKLSCILCTYNNHQVAYTSSENAKYLKGYNGYPFDRTILRTDFEKVAFNDLNSTLKNPKLQLNNFSFVSEEGTLHSEYLKDVLKSIDHQLTVRECGIDTASISNFLSVLPYLKPGVLNKITVLGRVKFKWREETMKHISRLDQWKQAEELELTKGFYGFPMDCATHFKRFHANELYMGIDHLTEVRAWLSELDNFEYCFIKFWEHWIRGSGLRELCAAIGEPAPPNDRSEYVSHYSIPDSNYYLEFLFFEETIEIRKKKRSNSGS